MHMICPICNNDAPLVINKGGMDYFQCESCRMIMSAVIEQENLVGGEYEMERNLENYIRIGRIEKMTEGIKKEDLRVLDFGCGTGRLVRDFRNAGYQCDGFDAYGSDEFRRLPERDKYHACTMIEVIEHTVSPFMELDVINRSLVVGGALLVETAFTNIQEEDKVPLSDWFYLNPKAGHSTIFSHHSIDLLMSFKSFIPRKHWNRNVRSYQKIRKG